MNGHGHLLGRFLCAFRRYAASKKFSNSAWLKNGTGSAEHMRVLRFSYGFHRAHMSTTKQVTWVLSWLQNLWHITRYRRELCSNPSFPSRQCKWSPWTLCTNFSAKVRLWRLLAMSHLACVASTFMQWYCIYFGCCGVGHITIHKFVQWYIKQSNY